MNFVFFVRQIVKFDVVDRRHVEWQQENCFPSEPVFVASPGAEEEDDGELRPPKQNRLLVNLVE